MKKEPVAVWPPKPYISKKKVFDLCDDGLDYSLRKSGASVTVPKQVKKFK